MAFSFFRKKESAGGNIVFTDKTYVSTAAKMNACLDLVKADPATVLICWFPETARQFKEFFNKNGLGETNITEARHIHGAMLQNKTPVFTEHYPLHEKEMELVKFWPQKQVLVFNALDEPLFQIFGGEKIISLMNMMGMKEEEAIEHVMVSKSISNAQEKIAKKITLEQSAISAADWMEKNVK